MRKFWKFTIITGIALVALFLALEIALRLIPQQYWRVSTISADRVIAYRKDKILLHTHIPGAAGFNTNIQKEFAIKYRVNSHGLRDVEHTWKKPPGTFRVLVVGDSFPEALQVQRDQSFPRILQKILNKTPRKCRVEVINAGVSGYSPLIIYLYLKHKGLKYKPDLVLLSYIHVYVGRDLRYRKWARFDAKGLPLACAHPEGETKLEGIKWLYQRIRANSRLVLFLHERIKVLVAKAKKTASKKGPASPKKPGSRNPDPAFTFKMVKAVNDLCRQNGAKMLLAFIPRGSQVKGESGRRAFPTDYAHQRPQKNMSRFCRENNVPQLDLLPAFNASKKNPLFFPVDGHLTPGGHQVVAGQTAKFMISHKMIPGPDQPCPDRKQ